MEPPQTCEAWGGSTHTAVLNRVESKAFRLINSSPLTDYLQPLFLCRNGVTTLENLVVERDDFDTVCKVIRQILNVYL